MKTAASRSHQLDPWEFQLMQEELREWTFTASYHMHKNWQFQTRQQAMKWYALARDLSTSHGRGCCFDLEHVGSGRIETDILNRIQSNLTRDDLNVAVMLNTLERKVKLTHHRLIAKDCHLIPSKIPDQFTRRRQSTTEHAM